MLLFQRRVPTALALAVLCLCGAAFAAGTSAVLQPERSLADCSGTSCMPGSGYTLDTTFDCGVILAATCYANGTTIRANAVRHRYGWASSAYNGAGSTNVGLCGYDGTVCYFGGTAVDLVRACYYDSCNAQTAVNLWLYVQNQGAYAHTIFGHGKA